MQKEQDTQFKFTPQVMMILVLVFFAMAIPVACIVLGAQSFFQKPAPALDPAAFAPLQKSLESIADQSFEEKTTLAPDQLLTIEQNDPASAREKVEAVVSSLGGVAFQSDSQSGEGEIHLLVQVPGNRVKTFMAAPLQANSGETSSTGSTADEARVLVNVVIKKKAQ